jgi:hypothetical protein
MKNREVFDSASSQPNCATGAYGVAIIVGDRECAGRKQISKPAIQEFVIDRTQQQE